jgi:hypothetical protein
MRRIVGHGLAGGLQRQMRPVQRLQRISAVAPGVEGEAEAEPLPQSPRPARGRPVYRLRGEVAAETAVGAGWFVVAWVLVTYQVHRARTTGDDDYA